MQAKVGKSIGKMSGLSGGVVNSLEGEFHCEDCEEFIEWSLNDYCNLHGGKASLNDMACVDIDPVINEVEQAEESP